MKTSHSLTCILLALCGACASQSPSPDTTTGAKQDAVAQACADPHVQCGDQPINISLHFSDGHAFKQVLHPPIPVVQYDHISLFPGETLYIEADEEDGKLVHLRAVATPEHPEKTLVLSFEQSGSNGGEGMLFSIHQPFSRPLKYHARVMDFDVPGSFKQSSTCPVAANGSGYESWPEPITQLMIGDFQFVDPNSSGSATCAN